MPAQLLIRAARGEPVERPPVWAMCQAGRWDPEFNRLRTGKTFYEFSEDVELSAAASLLPRRFGVDAIILFYDITTLAVAMGLPFTLEAGPRTGARPAGAVDGRCRIVGCDARCRSLPARARLARTVEKELKANCRSSPLAGIPVHAGDLEHRHRQGFGGHAPICREQPGVWTLLLDRIGSATVHFLQSLVEAGADAYQLFDSWAGLPSPDEYGNWAYAHHRTIFDVATGVPRILFVKEYPYLAEMTQSGADVVSLGKSHDLAEAHRRCPTWFSRATSTTKLMRTGTPEEVAAATGECIRAGGGRRHIVNLSHGMDRDVPVANFEVFIRTAKRAR